MEDKLTWHDNVITVDGREIITEYTIKDARLLDDRVIVLYKRRSPAGVPVHPVFFHNLVAYNLSGVKLWAADLPSKKDSEFYREDIDDSYIQIISTKPLIAYSWSSFDCTIDPSNGKLLDVEFVK